MIKNHCPFQMVRCHSECSWYDKTDERCLVWSFHINVSSFIKILQDYMSTQLKIQTVKEKTD
jgi:hypothetical protein